jgi:hypothetical protein
MENVFLCFNFRAKAGSLPTELQVSSTLFACENAWKVALLSKEMALLTHLLCLYLMGSMFLARSVVTCECMETAVRITTRQLAKRE